MNNKTTPVIITIGQRSVMAPKSFIFIGTGDRQKRYEAQLENYFMPMVTAAHNIEGTHRAVCQKEFTQFLLTGQYISEIAIPDVDAAATLGHLAKLLNAVKNGIPHSVHLNYALPKHMQLDVSKAVIAFVQKHAEFFDALYASMSPSPAPVVEEVKPVEETTDAA